MTPRINEANLEIDLTKYSETLLEQLTRKKLDYRLDGQGSVTEFIHPAVLKAQHLFTYYPEQLTIRTHSNDYSLFSFANLEEARAQYPLVKTYSGIPWEVYHFLQDAPTEALIHFEGLGSVFLSKIESFAPVLVPAVHHYTLPIYLDYALSGELWGPVGKWVRFHERLHSLFKNYGLLLDQDFPGFYPLKKDAVWLEKFGFKGQLTSKGFNLILTWDFPLSGLVGLEKALAREP